MFDTYAVYVQRDIGITRDKTWEGIANSIARMLVEFSEKYVPTLLCETYFEGELLKLRPGDTFHFNDLSESFVNLLDAHMEHWDPSVMAYFRYEKLSPRKIVLMRRRATPRSEAF